MLEGRKVKISYKPLWRLLLEKDMSKMDLLSVTKISTCTLSKLSKNEPLKIDTIKKICEAMNCSIENVIEFLPEEK